MSIVLQTLKDFIENALGNCNIQLNSRELGKQIVPDDRLMDLFELEFPEKITIDVTDICARFVNTLIFIECSTRFSHTHFSSFFRNIEAVDAKMGVILSFIRKFLGYVL